METKIAQVTKTVDTNYKAGFVKCENCGWGKDFGDGFNQHYIESCPNCDDAIHTRIQNKVTTGRPGNYTIKTGNFYYFVMSNGIHCQYKAQVLWTDYRSTLPKGW